MDHEVAFVRIGFCEVDLIPLTGLAEVDNVSQIFFHWRCDITVRRSKRVQLQIFSFCICQTSFRYGMRSPEDQQHCTDTGVLSRPRHRRISAGCALHILHINQYAVQHISVSSKSNQFLGRFQNEDRKVRTCMAFDNVIARWLNGCSFIF